MNFICEKKLLLKVVSSTDMIVKSKMSFSNFANLLIAAENNSIAITANNGDLSQKAFLQGEVTEPGEITLSQQRLLNILRQLPDGEVVFNCNQENLIEIKPVQSKRKMDTKLLGLPANDFPIMEPYPDNAKSIALDKSHFKKMIQKVAFAVAAHPTKYALNGILLELKEGKINLVASDSRRLAVFNTIISSPDKQSERIILAPELLNHLQRLFILDGSLTFCYQKEKIYFKFDEFVVSSNLINGEYPNYEMFFPQTHQYQVGANTADLIAAMNLATALMEGDPTHKIIFTLKKDELEVSAKVENYGEVKEKVGVVFPKEEELKIGLNAKMISEILRQVETEEVDIFFNEVTSPIIVKERNRNEYIYVIMPIKLGDDL